MTRIGSSPQPAAAKAPTVLTPRSRADDSAGSSTISTLTLRWLQPIPPAVAAMAALAGAAGLLQWAAGKMPAPALDPPAFRLPRPDAALGFLLAAAVLWTIRRPSRVASFGAAALATLGWATVLATAFRHPAAVGNLLFGGFAHLLGVSVAAPMPPAMALSLACIGTAMAYRKARPGLAAGLDVLIAFIGFTAVLSRIFAVPATADAAPGSQVNFLGAFLIMGLAGAHLAAFPESRPVSYFVDSSSAGRLLRRILPMTLIFPLALVVDEYASRRGAAALSRIAALLFVLGIVAFWVGLIWLVSRSLDRVDAAHRATEEELRISEESYRSLLEANSEGIISVGMDGNCRWCNPAAERMLGYERGALIGRNLHALLHHTRADGTPYPAEECTVLRAAAEMRGIAAAEEPYWRADGTSFLASFRSNPVLREGKPEAVVVMFTDATRLKDAENQLRQSQKMEAVGRLAAGIAHDFNNLLTVINGYSDLLLSQPQALPERTREKIANIRGAGEKAAALTHQLLAFSRQQVLQPKVLNLNLVLADMENLLRRVIGEDMGLEMVQGPDLAPVKADPSQLEQVLMNLVVNARDAMPQGGKITIETTNTFLDEAYAAANAGVVPGPYTLMAVTDTGMGMDEKTKALVFEPFFTTKPAGKGTGLGLATVFGIVKQSGGHIKVYSEPGFGTSIKVYLPSFIDSATPAAGQAPAASDGNGHESVLVIEDEEELGRLVQEVLEGNGYEVLRATEPQDAIALVRDPGNRIDLVISDVVLPGMNGREVVERIRESRPGIRVLFVSGYPDRAIARSGNLEPGFSFIQKPFTPAALVHKARELLDD